MTDVVVVLEPGLAPRRVEALVDRLRAYGLDVRRADAASPPVLSVAGRRPDGRTGAPIDLHHLRGLDGVEDVVRLASPYPFASRAWHPEDSVVDVDGVPVGGPEVIVIGGPCAVEGEAQIEAAAAAVAAAGARILRGGAFKPRSSPYSFQGLGEEGLRLLRQAADGHGLKVVTEVMRPEQVGLVAAYAHVLQVGSRNMQNYPLLQEVGRAGRPVLLKRGMAATVEEWLMSAEYVLAEGNPNVILCERGIRTFETATRNTLDLSAVPVVKERSHLPVIVDPSHGVGIRDKVTPLARAAVAAGADGLMVETHPDPAQALSDGPQSLYLDGFAELVAQVRRVAEAIGRTVGAGVPKSLGHAAPLAAASLEEAA